MADKKEKSRVGFKEFDPKKIVNTEPTLDEAVKGTAVISFGRMNPVTVGHEKLVNKVLAVAARAKATPLIYLSHSEDARKNPLSYNDKIKFAKQAFGKVIQKSKSRSIIEVAKELSGKFSNLIVVVGSDRVAEFNTLLNKYNGREYNFQVIDVQSAGERDPDADGVEGMSASKMRSLAADNDLNQFKKGLPKRLQRNADDVLSAVRQGMNMSEEKEQIVEALTRAQRRKRAMSLRRNRAKIKRGREKAMRRKADTKRLQKRAQKKAISFFKQKFSKHKRYADLPVGEKMRIDDKIKKIDKKRIERVARKMLIQVRKDERDRFARMATDNPLTTKRESVELQEKGLGGLFKPKPKAPKPSVPKTAIGTGTGRALGKIGGAIDKGVDKIGGKAMDKASDKIVDKLVKRSADDGWAATKAKDGMASMIRPGIRGGIGNAVKGAVKGAAAGIGANVAGRIAGRTAAAVMNKRDKNKRESFVEFMEGVKQDPDVKDMKGSQPAVYFKGVDKDKKDDRERHFKKHGKKADNDPSAYKPAPGDKEAKTKESKHTKKARAMGYTEELMWEDLIDGLDEASCAPAKRPHMLIDKNMKPKIDKRFKMFRPKMTESLEEYEIEDLMEATESFMEEWVCGQCNSEPCVCEGDGLQEDAAGSSLKKKAEKSGMPVGVLRQVFNRGKAAWKTGHRPGTTPDQWGHARVNSFITKSSGTWGKADKDLAAKVRGSKKNEETELDEVAPLLLVRPVKKAATKMAAKAADAVARERAKQEELDYEDERRKAIKKAKNKTVDTEPTTSESATNMRNMKLINKIQNSNVAKKGSMSKRGRSTMDRLRDIQKDAENFKPKKKKNEDLNAVAEAFLNEKLKKSDDMGTWIKDFYDSDAPQFKGKSKAQRRKMAVAAKLSAMDEEGGAGGEGTDKLVNRYKKDTPGE